MTTVYWRVRARRCTPLEQARLFSQKGRYAPPIRIPGRRPHWDIETRRAKK